MCVWEGERKQYVSKLGNSYLVLINEEGTLVYMNKFSQCRDMILCQLERKFSLFQVIVNIMFSLRPGPKDTGCFLWSYRIWKNLTWSLEGPQFELGLKSI